MKNLFFKTLYKVNQITFNVSDDGDVKTHRDPITGIEYAYGSSANVKRNLKERFAEISGIDTPKTEFKKKAEVKNKAITVNAGGDGEQSGVSIYIEEKNPNHIANIFGAWASDITDNTNKYVKAAIKSCIKVSDMTPVHPLLQKLSKNEAGVFVGDRNSTITLGVGKDTTLKTPEEAAEFAGCSIEEAKKLFSEQRPMNLYRDKKTANGIYQETFAIEIETFGKIKLSSYTISEEAQTELVAQGWRIMEIYGEKYLSPSRETLLDLWKNMVDAMLTWDFSSNNSLHGNQKEAIRYSMSLDANKINQCNSAKVSLNENDRQVATLALREHPSVISFNTTSLESVIPCDGIETSIDADEEAKAALIKLGEENIL
jgi:hypothetical protein